MTESLGLAPRYRLDNESSWLVGIDPSRQYWLSVNGDPQLQVIIPGLMVSSLKEFKEAVQQLHSLQPQENIKITRLTGSSKIHCINPNCYAIESRVKGALTWHLFDKKTLESLLMTSHPDWLPCVRDIELGRKLLARAFEQPAYAY